MLMYSPCRRSGRAQSASRTHRAGAVVELEVLLVLGLLFGLGLAEAVRLAEMVVVQLLHERLVGGFREHALLLQDRQDAHFLN